VIDYPTLWRIAQDSLPVLVAEIERLIAEGMGQQAGAQA
jgi:hypothetical protein